MADLDGAADPSGADQVWIPSGSSFDKYYVNAFFGAFQWRSVAGDSAIDAATVELTPGFIISNVGGADGMVTTAPDFYSTL